MDFELNSKEEVTLAFARQGIHDFYSACSFIADLPYRRNSNKSDILCVFEDLAGTCSIKHAVLRKLALENNRSDVKLMLGIFKMDADYTNKIANTLSKYGLTYIPEAHNYLKIGEEYYDFTKIGAQYTDVKDKLLFEQEIEFDEINSLKIKIHKEFLAKWVQSTTQFSLEEIWSIREKCIEDLQ